MTDHRAPPGTEGVLDAEERALAERLALGAPTRGPSPELDARILAAAGDAVAVHRSQAPTSASRRRSRTPRWPAMIGAAAVLVLTVGVVWQLRPVDEVQSRYEEASLPPPSAKAPGGGPQAEDMVDAAEMRAPMPPPQQDEATVAAEPAMADASAPPPSPSPSADGAANADMPANQVSADIPAAMTEEPPVIFDRVSPMSTTSIAPVPAPPPPSLDLGDSKAKESRADRRSPPAPFPAETGDLRDTAAESEPPMPAPAARDGRRSNSVSAATAIGTEATSQEASKPDLAAASAAGARMDRFGDQPIDDQPPATANAPDVRDAWLQRIRQLLKDGRIDAARASLHEFQRRHPEARLPDDLRPLVDE